MKKLILFFAAVFITATSANVFAQNTGKLPSVGSSHDYWVNKVASDHDAAHVGNSYRWWVSNDVTDLTNVLTNDDSFFLTESDAFYNTSTVDSFSIDFTWNAVSVGDTFYVVVEETGNCRNIKAIPVVPQNDFEVQFVALESDFITIGDSLSRCAPDIALTASGLDITYDYGVDTVMFKLAATGIYASWSFTGTFDLSTLGNTDDNIEYQIGTGGWTTTAPVTIPANAAGEEEVFIRVALDNGDTGGTAEEGLSEQTIKLTLSDVEDDGTNPALILNAVDADITVEPVQLHTIQARPNTSGIETDN